MKILIITLFLMLQSIYANTYPPVYSSFGTPLFKAVATFNTFKEIEIQSKHYEKFASEVLNAGNNLATSTKSGKTQKEEYIRSLRKLAKKYSEIIAILNNNLLLAIERDDRELFLRIVNSGLVGIAEKGEPARQAINYYEKHKTTMKSSYLEQMKVKLGQQRKLQELAEQNKTKKESKQNTVSFLRVVIHTTDIVDAGTSQLFIKFIINDRSEHPLIVFNSKDEVIKRGSVHTLENIKVAIAPEDINSITLEVDGYNAWHIKNISFQLRQKNKYSKEYKFDVKQWFSSELHDLQKLQGCSTKKTFSFTPSL